MTLLLLERRLQVAGHVLTHGTTSQKTRARWLLTARPEQVAPPGPWDVWLILAGRGWGKTRTGAEELADRARRHPNTRWAVVAPTYADARDTCVEGESGLLHALGDDVDIWNRSLGELLLVNGSRIKLFSADEPERLRGPQHHGAWCDELAAWRHKETWDQLQFGLRLGHHPQVIVTTTPRPTPLVRQLVDRAKADDGVVVRRGSTFDNAEHLAPAALAELRRRYEGTRLGRQELYAELLVDTPGALWTPDTFRRTDTFPDLQRLVVAVDPAVTSNEDSDESGIVAAGRHGDHAYILEDLSLRSDPTTVAHRVVDAYHDLAADRVAVEANNGGDWIPALINAIDPAVRVETVHATRGKQLRAQPVAGLYERGRVHHVGHFPQLEDQLCSWTPDDKDSPDRLDALVWAVTALFPELAGRAGRRRSIVTTEAA
jgi:phage terminase large subunit-like protein